MPKKNQFAGGHFKIIVNGRDSIDGEMYSVTFNGRILQTDERTTVYDIANQLVNSVRSKNTAMKFPHSMKFHIFPSTWTPPAPSPAPQTTNA